MANVRRWFVAMFVLYGTATCTRAKPRTNSERVEVTSSSAVASDVSTAHPFEQPHDKLIGHADEPPTNADFRRAMLAHDYARAHRLVDVMAEALQPPTVTLLRGFLALQLGQPQVALEQLNQLGDNFVEVRGWLRSLRADALLQGSTYVEHLEEIRAQASFRRLLAVAERLLTDKLFPRAERALALAQSASVGEDQQAELRWLRARLRFASGRAATAHADVRWLVVTHPNHPQSEHALAAIAHGEYPALSTSEHRARAEAAAELGLVEVVEQSIAATRDAASPRWPEGERAYLRGLALYRARRFGEAAAALDEAVRALATRRDRARYLAAIAASRSGAGDDALRRFTTISTLQPVTDNVQNAAFLVAREHSLLGNFAAAAEHYTQFVTRFPHHEFAEAAYRERLIAWFGEGNYKRFIYWVRQFRERYPQSKEGLLLRSLEALALSRLGHADQAIPLWQDLARAAPLSFVGVAARQHLKRLGVVVASPFKRGAAPIDARLPDVVGELEMAGLSEQSESAFRIAEAALARRHAPNDAAALCHVAGQLERGRRRFELGRGVAARRGLGDAPQLAPDWLWPCLFPSPHALSVSQHAKTHGVAPALIYAVMRQESGFVVDALSSAGARGLMQVIEPTARRIAKELGRSYDATQLRIAHHNIEYGTFYLSKLQSHFVHPALVAAAYNAGPHAATRWYAAGHQLPLEAFIARIPYDETRAYVQRVLENLVVYETLLGAEPVPELALVFTPGGDAALPTQAVHRAPDGFY